jgi:hypothetical protein
MKHFFISYNRADRPWAEWIAWQLEAATYAVVIQAWDFREGRNFVLEMQRAVEEAQRTMIVLSPDFLASQFTAPEWAAAFAKDPTGAQGLLVPVRVRDCTPTGLLAQINYIDLVGVKSREEARKRLLNGVASMRPKPTVEPALPQSYAGRPLVTVRPEPQWPPALGLAGSVLWRIVRIAGTVLGMATAVLWFVSASLPEWFATSPGEVYSTALMWGVIAAVLGEGGLRLWRRFRGVGAANPSRGSIPE